MAERCYPQDYFQNQTKETVPTVQNVSTVQQKYFPYYQDYKSGIIIGATILSIGIIFGVGIIYVNLVKK